MERGTTSNRTSKFVAHADAEDCNISDRATKVGVLLSRMTPVLFVFMVASQAGLQKHSTGHHYVLVEQCVAVATHKNPSPPTLAKLPIFSRSVQRKPNESMRLVVVTIVGVVFGFFIGISFPTVSITKLHFPSSIVSYIEDKNSGLSAQAILNHAWTSAQAILNHAWTSARNARGNNGSEPSSNTTLKIYVPTNPRGAEMLPPDELRSLSDGLSALRDKLPVLPDDLPDKLPVLPDKLPVLPDDLPELPDKLPVLPA